MTVVGTCTTCRPRKKVDAAKPATSPTTPPPNAITTVPRSAPAWIHVSYKPRAVASVLDRSPGGSDVHRSTLSPALARERLRAVPYVAVTFRSDTTSTRVAGTRDRMSSPPFFRLPDAMRTG